MKAINAFLYNEFIFSPRYRVWRHIIYWAFHINVWAAFWVFMTGYLSYARYLLNMAMWIPGFILFSYPLVYGAIPHLLLKGRVIQFLLVILGWGFLGLYIDMGYRIYILIPAQEAMGLTNIIGKGHLAFCFLCMTTSAASPMIIKFFKLWTIKQRDLMQAQQEKTTAELQVLKAQVHPHFLFNTLNNIYSFALQGSSKTPGLILKLSSLLSYMLYDCKAEEVRLAKEIEVMKDYIELERERYGNKIDISWSAEAGMTDHFIAPLIMMPILENSFKHGLSEQIEKPWLSVDISVRQNTLYCKIANSKNESVPYNQNGIGLNNVRKRLEFIYAGRYELKVNDEGNFFVVAIQIRLSDVAVVHTLSVVPSTPKMVSA